MDLQGLYCQEVRFGLDPEGSGRWLKREVCFVNVKSGAPIRFHFPVVPCIFVSSYDTGWMSFAEASCTTARSVSCPIDVIDMEHDRYLL